MASAEITSHILSPLCSSASLEVGQVTVDCWNTLIDHRRTCFGVLKVPVIKDFIQPAVQLQLSRQVLVSGDQHNELAYPDQPLMRSNVFCDSTGS